MSIESVPAPTPGPLRSMTMDVVEHDNKRMVLSMGPQHPSTHGVLQVITEIEGEVVNAGRAGDRLPSYRHRKVGREFVLDAGVDGHRADGLPLAALEMRSVTF